jgi:hypothetical protein
VSTNPIDLRLRELSREAKKTTADRMVESMSEVHRRLLREGGRPMPPRHVGHSLHVVIGGNEDRVQAVSARRCP